MKHSFAATNPCHVFDMALALFQRGALGAYYSGYPRWRLRAPQGFPIREKSFRTLVTYGLQRLPETLRPDDWGMFQWQDRGFDRSVASALEGEGFIHGLPGQCEAIFKRAKELGMRTILNHASGPIAQQRKLVAPEYERLGLDLEKQQPLPESYKERIASEIDSADFHCAASTVVRDQLVADGIPLDRIWVVPYGADGQVFSKRAQVPDGPFRICFAGRQTLRKGIHYLLKALESIDSSGWELHCFGMPSSETAPDFQQFSGKAGVINHGAVSQKELASAFQNMHALVLPSAEEAFGLVVVQALESGVPCIVSDRVGAKDLIREGETGGVVPFGDSEALAGALQHWNDKRTTVEDRFPWSACAERLMEAAGA